MCRPMNDVTDGVCLTGLETLEDVKVTLLQLFFTSAFFIEKLSQ